jgi:hypothetical protein
MSGWKDPGATVQLDAQLVDPAGNQRLGFPQRVTPRGVEQAARDEGRAAVGRDVAQLDTEEGQLRRRAGVQHHGRVPHHFQVTLQRRRGVHQRPCARWSVGCMPGDAPPMQVSGAAVPTVARYSRASRPSSAGGPSARSPAPRYGVRVVAPGSGHSCSARQYPGASTTVGSGGRYCCTYRAIGGSSCTPVFSSASHCPNQCTHSRRSSMRGPG